MRVIAEYTNGFKEICFTEYEGEQGWSSSIDVTVDDKDRLTQVSIKKGTSPYTSVRIALTLEEFKALFPMLDLNLYFSKDMEYWSS